MLLECARSSIPARYAYASEPYTQAQGYVVYITNFGYSFHDGTTSRTMICDSEGYWHTHWQIKRKSCDSVSEPTYASCDQSVSNLATNVVVTCTCLEGHYFSNGLTQMTFVCDENGAWSDSSIDCLCELEIKRFSNFIRSGIILKT